MALEPAAPGSKPTTATTTTTVPLFHAHDNVGYRLVELPPELQAALECDHPPVLSLESTPSGSTLLLKGPEKSYAMRQKNTSNALMLLSTLTSSSPVSSKPPSFSTVPIPEPPGGLLAVIATLHETMELDEYKDTPQQRAPTVDGTAKAPRGKWHERFGTGR